MPKSKKRGTKGRRRVNNTMGVPSSNPRSGLTSQALGGHHKTVVGLTNPFSEAAKGARIPDDDSARSFTAQIKQYHTMTTDSNGEGFTYWQPQADRWNGKSFDVSSGVLWGTPTDLENPDYLAYTNSTEALRIVSWGVRIVSILPGLTSQGTVRLVTMNEPPVAAQAVNGNLYEDIKLLPITDLEAHWVSKPVGVDWKAYQPTAIRGKWNSLGIYIDGAPISAAALTLEIVYNVEVIPQFGSITASVAKPGLPSNPQHLAAASRVHASHSGVHGKRPSLMSTFSSLAMGALRDVAAQSIPFVGGAISRLIGKIGGQRQPQMIMDVD